MKKLSKLRLEDVPSLSDEEKKSFDKFESLEVVYLKDSQEYKPNRSNVAAQKRYK